MHCSLPGSSSQGTPKARILEWVAIPFSRDLPNGENKPWSSALWSESSGSELPKKPLSAEYIMNHKLESRFGSVQFSLVTETCPALCDPMNHSTPGLPVHHKLLESTQTHVHWVGDAIQISSSVIPFSSCPQSFPASESFQMSHLFASGGQSIGVSALTSFLPMNTQDWSPLGWTSLSSLQSKGLSRVFSNTTVQKNLFFGTQVSL